MHRREFIKGSAIIGAAVAIPSILKATSGMVAEKGRKVHRVISANKTMVGTLPVLRAFAGDHNDYVSPYVFFDEFNGTNINTDKWTESDTGGIEGDQRLMQCTRRAEPVVLMIINEGQNISVEPMCERFFCISP